MLTRELLRVTWRNGRFRCRFIDPADGENLRPAAGLVAVYAGGEGRCRGELAELSRNVVNAARDRKLAAGLEKLVQERALFSSPEDGLDYVGMRRELFRRAGEVMARPGDFSEESCRRAIAPPGFDIYGDLPDFEVLVSFKSLTPAELLQRYNTALVQGLLMHTETLSLIIADPEPAELRKVVKFMKFFRLLAEISRPEPGVIRLEVSGPFALLEHSRKYAIQLASFFPAVLKLKKFRLEARVKMEAREGLLELSEADGLVSHYRDISAYVPEEIRLFHRLFKERNSPWTIVGETPFINMGKEGICFPDLSFRHETGAACHLELFHRWHKGTLARRVAFLAGNPETPLIVGIDRGAADDASFEELIRRFPGAAGKLFRFRDFPGVETVVRMLDSVMKIEHHQRGRKK